MVLAAPPHLEAPHVIAHVAPRDQLCFDEVDEISIYGRIDRQWTRLLLFLDDGNIEAPTIDANASYGV